MNEPRIDPNREVLVDVSNVCRDRELRPAHAAAAWSRYTRLVSALRRSGARDVVGVADASLLGELSGAERRRLRDAERAGDLIVVPGSADDALLRRAEETGALVASMDQFRGHRRLRPWLQGCTDRVLGWRETAGALHVVPITLKMATAQSVSRGEEADTLRERHLDPLHRRAGALASGIVSDGLSLTVELVDEVRAARERSAPPSCRWPAGRSSTRSARWPSVSRIALGYRDADAGLTGAAA